MGYGLRRGRGKWGAGRHKRGIGVGAGEPLTPHSGISLLQGARCCKGLEAPQLRSGARRAGGQEAAASSSRSSRSRAVAHGHGGVAAGGGLG